MKHVTPIVLVAVLLVLGVVAMTLGPRLSSSSLSAYAESASGKPVPEPDAALNPPAPEEGMATAVFAGGCFWCTEVVFEQLRGVASVVSGYAGGAADDANYQMVSAGATEHAEAIQITYEPSIITYGELLKVFFTVAHDPTQLNRQGPDHGKQYRSAVFFATDAEKAATQDYIRKLTEAGYFAKPIVTTLEPLTKFHEAEAYHQDYVQRNPLQPYVRVNALPKVEKVRAKFGEMTRGE